MDENQTNMHEDDELTARIARRLGERQRKLEQMARWEQQPAKSRFRRLCYAAAVAACIAAVVLLVPRGSRDYIDELGIGAPQMESYRAASADAAHLNLLIQGEKYQEALDYVTPILKKSDWNLYELEGAAEALGDDESIYEEQEERLQNNELRWTRIYLLLKLGMNKEAKKELRKYLRWPDYCQHLDEAKALKKKL